ncbi:MAG: hypothetical protein GXY34_01155 [Syntrophomonadaceae bacterium]|nr:hypothetical protein [Syntrophomonadaceae bacterium]
MSAHHTQSIPIEEPSNKLEYALEQCQKAARHGYEIAEAHLMESAMAISVMSNSLLDCLNAIELNPIRTPGIVDQLKNQLTGVIYELEQLQRNTELDLEERIRRLDRFSITLFGRTMAGKSTLMEILTRGDGSSIGKGAQRTTRDVRSYDWKGMEITDVPGIAAFEGNDDEELAYKSASQADLILFLITDDAPQPVEAECLANILRIGKPVLGICNIKAAVDVSDDLDIFLRNPNRYFDPIRIKQLINQFNIFTHEYIPGNRIPFVAAHLRSRFLANQTQDPGLKEKLEKASRFSDIEDYIIRDIIGRGTFLRTKSFIDGALLPVLNLTDMLLDFSSQNSASGRVLVGKRRQFYTWANEFKIDGEQRIYTLVSKICNNLRDDIPVFAEDHFGDKKAGEKWTSHIKSSGINDKINNLQKALIEDCRIALIEITRELKTELSLVSEFTDARNIKTDSIFDTKRAWNWSVNFVTGGLTLAAIILGSGPLGWAAAGVGILGWAVSLLFDSREAKTQRARHKLIDQLKASVDRIEIDLRTRLIDWFHKELFNKLIYIFLNDLKTVTSGLFELADAQRVLSWTLTRRQKDLNRILIKEAFINLGAIDELNYIQDVARIPGIATMLMIKPDVRFPGPIRVEIERLLGEPLWFVINNENEKSILSQAIGRGCSKEKINIEWDLRVVHVPMDEFDLLTKSRIKLAQQLTELHIVK